jgi:hypothetical protein
MATEKRNTPFLAYFFLFATALLATGCQKEVKVDLQSAPPQLVVQGQIENGLPPVVLLTKSIGFFSTVDFSTVENLFVHDAVVKVSDGIKTISLREYVFDTAGNNKFYFWTVDTTNLANIMLGALGSYYTLTIEYNGVTHSSTVKIPYPKGPDSVWLAPPNIIGRSTPSTAQELFCSYTDPDTPGNYVRYFTSRNGDAYYAGGLYSDEFVNGKFIASVDLFAGFNDSARANVDSLLFFYKGDSISLKWCVIDKSVYDFWNTYQFSVQTGGNPFTTPINVKSNINNGALGVWCGYGTLFYNLKAH